MNSLDKLRLLFVILALIILFRIFIYESSGELKTKNLKACFIVLLRNSDLNKFISTMNGLEKNFNHKHNYPYIIFNDVDFDDNFRREIVKHTKSNIEFAKISSIGWSIPSWIDLNRRYIGYHGLDYQKMCRFFSGYFFREQRTLNYDLFWRLDVDSEFNCPILQDPFQVFRNDPNILYGFGIANYEHPPTMPTLWSSIKKWVNNASINIRSKMPDPSSKRSILKFVSNDQGKSLTSLCIFYNNLELGRFDLFRSETYLSYFEHLNKEGGFFYERWGDAPVHTYFVSLMLDTSQVHFYDDIHYKHQIDQTYKLIEGNRCVSSLNSKFKYKFLFN